MNDPKVLAGLQQAYLASDLDKTSSRIMNAWDFEVYGQITAGDTDAEIRAWSPPAELVLDPVRVEAAAKAAWEVRDGSIAWSDVTPLTKRTWIGDAEVAIRSYLTEGAS